MGLAQDRVDAVERTMSVLCDYYADKDGRPYRLNATQAAVYTEGLAPFSDAELEAAAREHMRRSQFFPRLSDLLKLLAPATDFQALAHLAWARLEREVRRIGAYRTVSFADPAFGEAVRQVFGSWATACSIDVGGPEWAIRRQTFLQVFPLIAEREELPPVTMGGLHRGGETVVIGHLEGLPAPRLLADVDRSKSVLAEVQRRFLEKRK